MQKFITPKEQVDGFIKAKKITIKVTLASFIIGPIAMVAALHFGGIELEPIFIVTLVLVLLGMDAFSYKFLINSSNKAELIKSVSIDEAANVTIITISNVLDVQKEKTYRTRRAKIELIKGQPQAGVAYLKIDGDIMMYTDDEVEKLLKI